VYVKEVVPRVVFGEYVTSPPPGAMAAVPKAGWVTLTNVNGSESGSMSFTYAEMGWGPLVLLSPRPERNDLESSPAIGGAARAAGAAPIVVRANVESTRGSTQVRRREGARPAHGRQSLSTESTP
jgi:hypothetical protein